MTKELTGAHTSRQKDTVSWNFTVLSDANLKAWNGATKDFDFSDFLSAGNIAGSIGQLEKKASKSNL